MEETWAGVLLGLESSWIFHDLSLVSASWEMLAALLCNHSHHSDHGTLTGTRIAVNGLTRDPHRRRRYTRLPSDELGNIQTVEQHVVKWKRKKKGVEGGEKETKGLWHSIHLSVRCHV